MKIGILFFSDTYVLEDKQCIMGRFVANNQFIEAIHKRGHSIYLYVSSETEKEYLAQKLGDTYSNLEIVSVSQLYFQSDDYLPDILHILSPNMYRCFYLRNEVFKKNIPVTGVTHSLGHAVYLDWVFLNLIHGPLQSDGLICTSATAKAVVENMQIKVLDHIGSFDRFKTKVIPLGIQTTNYDLSVREKARSSIGLNESDFCLLWVGRFSYSTKTDLAAVLTNLSSLMKESHSRNLKFICAGALESEFDKNWITNCVSELSIQKNVHFEFNISDETKKNLYLSADCFLAPSDNVQETFGLSVVEALDAGLPVIAYDWDGYKSILDEKCGFFVPTYSVGGAHMLDTLAPLQLDFQNHFWMSQTVFADYKFMNASILKLMNSPKLCVEMSSASRERSLDFTWEAVVKKYELYWAELIERSKLTRLKETGPVLDYRSDFATYSRHHLSDSVLLRTSTLGESLLKGQISSSIYPEMETWFSSSLIKDILLKAIQPLSIESLRLAFNDEASLLSIHYMWLLKNGYIQIEN